MPVISIAQAGTLNRCAFLDMLAVSEGTSNSSLTINDGYDVIVEGIDGPEVFTDYRAHPFFPNRPPKVINDKGLRSTASGRYQFMLKDYVAYRNLLKLSDFGPLSQDRWALQLIREARALPMIDAGDLVGAVAACTHLWASLPGNDYGQHQNAFDSLRATFILNGGRASTT